MKRHYRFIPLLLVVALVACRSVGAPAARPANLGQEVQLAPGEQVEYAQQGLTVEFVRVTEDSRCPTDVTCAWAGEVKAQLSIRTQAAAPAQREVKAGEPAMIDKLRLLIVRVQPERISTREIPPAAYRITLKVEQPSD